MNSISENNFVGYILEVDPEYPNELHKLHNGYPLAPEKVAISQNMLSNYCFNIVSKYRINICGVNKLVPDLDNKGKYLVHYTNLQLHLLLVVKLTKVHRILKFKQSDWLKTYIDFNTDKKEKCS